MLAVLHVPTIKPLDEATILREARPERTPGGRGREPHGDRRPRRGGRGLLLRYGRCSGAFRQVALPDEFLDAGALPTLHDRYGISAEAMASQHQGLAVTATSAQAPPGRKQYVT